MNDALQFALAQMVYEKACSRLSVTKPMITWENLLPEEREQMGKAMDLWIRGLGTNEVQEEWFQRSAAYAQTIWDQLGYAEITTFKVVSYEMIVRLVELAEKEQNGQEETKQMKKLIADQSAFIATWKPYAGREALTEMRSLVTEAIRLTGDASLALPAENDD